MGIKNDKKCKFAVDSKYNFQTDFEYIPVPGILPNS